MGVCSSQSTYSTTLGYRAKKSTSMERQGTDSSSRLNNQDTEEDIIKNKLNDTQTPLPTANKRVAEATPKDQAEADHLLVMDKKYTIESLASNNIYYDAVAEENRFPLKMSDVHHFEPFEGLEERIQQALATDNKKPLRNAFTDPPAHLFRVRGPDYLRDGKGAKNQKNLKVPSKESPYELIGVNMFRTPNQIQHVAEEVGETRRFLESFPADKEDSLLPEFLFINWTRIPQAKKGFFFVQHAFRLRPGARQMKDEALNNAFRRFLNGTDAEKTAQFKYVFRAVDVPRPVKAFITFLGGERPMLIAKSLTTTYNRGRNYLEINMDVSSSRIASAINGLILKNVEIVVIDFAWLLESTRQEELPERILAKIRWIWNCVDEVVIQLDKNGERVPEKVETPLE